MSRKSSTEHRPKARPSRGGKAAHRWSAHVIRTSHALDLDKGVFTLKESRRIALSLKRSAERSKRRKGMPYQSAMSMLTFYINRAEDRLPKDRRRVLERAKDELRKCFQK
jgi:hypothetical protein